MAVAWLFISSTLQLVTLLSPAVGVTFPVCALAVAVVVDFGGSAAAVGVVVCVF